MRATIRFRVRHARRPQQRKPERIPFHGATVSTVIENRQTSAWFGKIHEPMAGKLESGRLPGGISMSRMFLNTELDSDRSVPGPYRRR